MARVRTAERSAADDPLLRLMNVGPVTRGYLAELGINTVEALAKADPDELYVRLQAQRQHAFDPCVHDTFTAAIHQARTGEAKPWYSFTPERKRGTADGAFNLTRPGPQFSREQKARAKRTATAPDRAHS